MDFELTSEHLMVKESATSFVKKEHSLDRLRKLKADPLGYSTDVWRKMIDLGWLGLVFPEEYGGLGLDFSFVMVLLEEFGRGLLPEPWISNILLGANTVLIGGSESQKDEIIPKVISGDCQVTLAYLEDDGRYDVNYCAVGGREINDGFAISGKKIFVLDGCSADKFIVSVRTSGSPRDTDGISLFMVIETLMELKCNLSKQWTAAMPVS